MPSPADLRRLRVGAALAVLAVFAVGPAYPGTILRFATSMGQFDVELRDDEAPLTVANFLNYVNRGDYMDTFFHRSAELGSGQKFVLQGGGFGLYPDGAASIYPVEDGELTRWIGEVPTDAPVVNEYNTSNIRGTVAMAKQGGDPDSATSQFFFNLSDNSANLDNQNGGFTVFAEVIGAGMDIVDLLASQQVWDASPIHGAFAELPLDDYDGSGTLRRDNMLLIYNVVVVPAAGVLGDANGDGVTDVVDLTIVAANWEFQGPLGLSGGDFNGDDLINKIDHSYVWIGWGLGDFGGGALPEPASAVLLLAALPWVLRHGGRHDCPSRRA